MVLHRQNAGAVGKVVRESCAICDDDLPVAIGGRTHEPQVDVEVAKPDIHLNAELLVSVIYLDEALRQRDAPCDVFSGLTLAPQDFLGINWEHGAFGVVVLRQSVGQISESPVRERFVLVTRLAENANLVSR